MCCSWLAGSTGRKKDAKIGHLRTITQFCWAVSSQLSHISTIGKKLLKQQYLLHMPSQYGELPPTNGLDWLTGLVHPSKFERGSCLGFSTATTSLSRSYNKLCTIFGRLLGWCTICTFSGTLAPNGILPGAKFTSQLISTGFTFWQRYCTALW